MAVTPKVAQNSWSASSVNRSPLSCEVKPVSDQYLQTLFLQQRSFTIQTGSALDRDEKAHKEAQFSRQTCVLQNLFISFYSPSLRPFLDSFIFLLCCQQQEIIWTRYDSFPPSFVFSVLFSLALSFWLTSKLLKGKFTRNVKELFSTTRWTVLSTMVGNCISSLWLSSVNDKKKCWRENIIAFFSPHPLWLDGREHLWHSALSELSRRG